jgi:hypothetical protein
MRTKLLEDGTIVEYLSPREGMPFYNDWLQVLYARGAAIWVPEVDERGKGIIDPETGLPKLKLEPLASRMNYTALQPARLNDDVDVEILCIGCGKGFQQRTMDRIEIGGWIQVRDKREEPEKKRIVMGWKSQPVSKTGLGCEACQKAYRDACEAIAGQNQQREMLAALIAAATASESEKATEAPSTTGRCLHGLKEYCCSVCLRNKGQTKASVKTVRLPGQLTAFIEVL